METVKIIVWIITWIAIIFYAYQVIYVPIPYLLKPHIPKKAKKHKYAILICARNEAAVICDLITSIQNQTYDKNLITTFVMADNCFDNTAALARNAGAIVYERSNTQQVGKGYALDTLLQNIASDFPDGFDGYFIFDADNILKPDYIEKMNLVFSNDFDIVTSYRNSKNFGDNWISAGYGLAFLRESRYLNYSRMLIGSSCAVSGTGFLFSKKIFQEQNGRWPFFLLTEDIEFSVHYALKGYKIGFAQDAVLYDEQPTSFKQSWRQRLRWARGNLQVLRKYGWDLIKQTFKGSFSCFDLFMTVSRAYVLTFISLFGNLTFLVIAFIQRNVSFSVLCPFLESIAAIGITLFLVAIITTISEWKYIHIPNWKKILYIFTFPLFMITYIPITIHAMLSRKVSWKPIKHSRSTTSVPFLDKNT